VHSSTPDDRELRLGYFRAKLAAEAELMAAVRQVETGEGDFVLLDVRDRSAYAAGHIPGALSLPLDEVAVRADELARERKYVAYCWRTT
jgi:rhodanese-related sulfurtransferase